jgi:hypothetical protein
MAILQVSKRIQKETNVSIIHLKLYTIKKYTLPVVNGLDTVPVGSIPANNFSNL